MSTTPPDDHVHDGSVEDCAVCLNVREIKIGGMAPDGSMTDQQQAAAVTDVLAQLPEDLQKAIQSKRGPEGIREVLGFYQECLSGKPTDPPRPGDPRVQLAMAVLNFGGANILPGLKRRCAEVVSAALFMRVAVEEEGGSFS